MVDIKANKKTYNKPKLETITIDNDLIVTSSPYIDTSIHDCLEDERVTYWSEEYYE